MWKVLGGVAAGYVLAQWVVPALFNRPSPTSATTGAAASADSGELGIHRITGDVIDAFDKIKPFLWQIHVDSADRSMSAADYIRAARQLERSGVI